MSIIKHNLKKLSIVLALILLMGIGLVACSKDDGNKGTQTPPETPENVVLDTSEILSQVDTYIDFSNLIYDEEQTNMNIKIDVEMKVATLINDVVTTETINSTIIAVDNVLFLSLDDKSSIMFTENGKWYHTESDKEHAEEIIVSSRDGSDGNHKEPEGGGSVSILSLITPFLNDEFFDYVDTKNNINNFEVPEDKYEDYVNAVEEKMDELKNSKNSYTKDATSNNTPPLESVTMSSTSDNKKFDLAVNVDDGTSINISYDLGEIENPLK